MKRLISQIQETSFSVRHAWIRVIFGSIALASALTVALSQKPFASMAFGQVGIWTALVIIGASDLLPISSRRMLVGLRIVALCIGVSGLLWMIYALVVLNR